MLDPTIATYADTHRRAAAIPQDIEERWNTRMVGQGLVHRGASGAIQYLNLYGRGLGQAKAVNLARCAERHGEDSIAAVFWERAMKLDPAGAAAAAAATGATPSAAPAKAARARKSSVAAPVPTVAALPCPSLPADLQPGVIAPWQPVDAVMDRASFVKDPAYWGMPKRDGSKCILICSDGEIAFQSRRGGLRDTPHPALTAAIQEACGTQPWVLEGEQVFIDATGGEHRTGAQAATANASAGNPQGGVVTQFSVFGCLAAEGVDCRPLTAGKRIADAEEMVARVATALAARPDAEGVRIEMVPTARTPAEKQVLIDTQLAEGREGEVWFRHSLPYQSGAASPEDFCRTKYLTETECVIAGLTPSTAPGRLFAAIEVMAEKDGTRQAVGSVGTGFSATDMARLVAQHAMRPGCVKVLIRHQGWTENGVLWHPRFVEILDGSKVA